MENKKIDPKDAIIHALRVGVLRAVKEIKTGYAHIDELEERDEDDVESGQQFMIRLIELTDEEGTEVAAAMDEVVAAARAQHEALDRLMAMMILKDPTFMPSKSGQPWDAITQGHQAIKRLDEALK